MLSNVEPEQSEKYIFLPLTSSGRIIIPVHCNSKVKNNFRRSLTLVTLLFRATNFTFRARPVIVRTRGLRLAILKRQLPYSAMLQLHLEGNTSFGFYVEYPGSLPQKCKRLSSLLALKGRKRNQHAAKFQAWLF